MTLIHDSLFMRALRREPVSRTPVWLMRQAGRYLPEYREVRAKAGDFLSLCKNKQLACEVTLQPLRRFPLDAAIIFSDILTIPDAMGLGLYFAQGEGPRFKYPLDSLQSIEALSVPKVEEELAYVMDATRLIRAEMPSDLPLIGFSGSPWTLACYMLEGKSSPDFLRMQTLIAEHPEVAERLLDKLSLTVVDYLRSQVQAGVNALMIFDTWGGLLSTEGYLRFSLTYMQKIVRLLKEQDPLVPVILFTKGGGKWIKVMAESGCSALGLDWTIDMGLARQLVGDKVALQGNLQPSILLQDEVSIKAEVARILAAYGPNPGHIFNLGHGITPEVHPEKVQVMLEAVYEYSVKQRDSAQASL